MPELPEVETIRRQLAKEITGAVIRSVDVRFAGRLNVSASTVWLFPRRSAKPETMVVPLSAGLKVLRTRTGIFSRIAGSMVFG